jgi:hypothetical protein
MLSNDLYPLMGEGRKSEHQELKIEKAKCKTAKQNAKLNKKLTRDHFEL